jgi:hypothetical protein
MTLEHALESHSQWQLQEVCISRKFPEIFITDILVMEWSHLGSSSNYGILNIPYDDILSVWKVFACSYQRKHVLILNVDMSSNKVLLPGIPKPPLKSFFQMQLWLHYWQNSVYYLTLSIIKISQTICAKLENTQTTLQQIAITLTNFTKVIQPVFQGRTGTHYRTEHEKWRMAKFSWWPLLTTVPNMKSEEWPSSHDGHCFQYLVCISNISLWTFIRVIIWLAVVDCPTIDHDLVAIRFLVSQHLEAPDHL